MKNIEEIQKKADLVRKWCMVSTTEAGSGHPTSCLSIADVATVLFNNYFAYNLSEPLNKYNDRLVLSKGHAAPLLYTLFGVAGAYPLEELKTLRKFGSKFEGHPVPKFKYAEAATGSLGQGLSVGAGLALVGKRENLPFKTYVILGDGELAEGQVWEAANFASYHKLENLVAILDINRLAQSGETMFGHDMDQYTNRFKGFGFEVINIDGHNLTEIDNAFKKASANNTGKPIAIIARTMKGAGISFLENKDNWHGKALKPEELEQALKELGEVDDSLRFELKNPDSIEIEERSQESASSKLTFEDGKSYATREVFGEVFAELGASNPNLYCLDADVKNSTYTLNFLEKNHDRFVECFIAEQNMVSVAAGLSRIGKIPFVATFAAFLSRAADQIRMARVSESNIKFLGSHVGVSIGEDGPSQMGLEDISLFGAEPDVIVLQPCDAVSTAKLVPLMISHSGIAYMRTLRPKTKIVYQQNDELKIGGSKILKQSDKDILTIVASGITVFEALDAADELEKEGIVVCVVDCYSINPIDKQTLVNCVKTTEKPLIITVEDHYTHGGMGDFVNAALSTEDVKLVKMAVTKISTSGTKEQLMRDAGITAVHIIKKVKELIKS
ncbi:MAG TPA: transketolase [Pelobium sp.]|nr:transketolase [Pelobium sp.]